MKIPKEIVHFDGKQVLIIVASMAHAEFYRATGDTIVKAESFKVGKPNFSDEKSYFANTSSGRGWKVASSSVEQLVKKDVIQRFDKRFKEYFKTLTSKYKFDEIYIFCPSHFATEVERLIPSPMRKKISMVFKGNYHKLHPKEILEKIGKKYKPGKKTDIAQTTRRTEAGKIMRKSIQAKAVIKNPRK